MFDKLYSEAEAIHDELGFTLEWQRLDNKKASRLFTILADWILTIMKTMMN